MIWFRIYDWHSENGTMCCRDSLIADWNTASDYDMCSRSTLNEIYHWLGRHIQQLYHTPNETFKSRAIDAQRYLDWWEEGTYQRHRIFCIRKCCDQRFYILVVGASKSVSSETSVMRNVPLRLYVFFTDGHSWFTLPSSGRMIGIWFDMLRTLCGTCWIFRSSAGHFDSSIFPFISFTRGNETLETIVDVVFVSFDGNESLVNRHI